MVLERQGSRWEKRALMGGCKRVIAMKQEDAMRRIKMLVFDVDGTLYDLKKHEIPKSAITAIQRAKENGYLFVIASGRAHYGLGKALNDLRPDYVLSMSGGVVSDGDGTIISHHDMKEQDVAQLLAFCHKQEAGLVFKFLDHMYIYQHPEKINWLEGQMNSDIGKEPFIDCPSQDHHLVALPQSASIHADPAAVKRVFKDHERLVFLPYSKDGYDVVPKGIHKGVGLRTLMEHLHLSKEEVACIGDNFNDLEMMAGAGVSIAMGNAVEAVKAFADYITTASDQDGIYHALNYLGCF